MDNKHIGRVTIPTDVDVVPETLEILRRWGADAIRDCDGAEYPAQLPGLLPAIDQQENARKEGHQHQDHPQGGMLFPKFHVIHPILTQCSSTGGGSGGAPQNGAHRPPGTQPFRPPTVMPWVSFFCTQM